MTTTLIEEEVEAEAEVLMVVVIDLMDKEINIKIIEANKQDMNHRENFHRLNSLRY